MSSLAALPFVGAYRLLISAMAVDWSASNCLRRDGSAAISAAVAALTLAISPAFA
jgi:hypothetical protein